MSYFSTIEQSEWGGVDDKMKEVIFHKYFLGDDKSGRYGNKWDDDNKNTKRLYTFVSKRKFDEYGNILKPENSTIDMDRISGGKKSLYLNANSSQDGNMGYNIDGSWYFDYSVGQRYGLNTETANSNPTFKINKASGVINFSSGAADKLVILEYVSDGMENGVDSEINLNKLFEDFIYAYIKYAILTSKYGVQEYIINRAKKEKSALLRNAKIRLSNIHPGRLLMNLRGQDKWLK